MHYHVRQQMYFMHFPHLKKNNAHSMSLWIESVSVAGFQLGVGMFNNMVDYNHHIKEPDAICVKVGCKIVALYFAVCQVKPYCISCALDSKKNICIAEYFENYVILYVLLLVKD